jgi:sugar O-acyltransferase (sialic acid O-acetyltransferase NeuD family)
MINDNSLGKINVIFDPTLNQSSFESDAKFISSTIELKKEIQLLSHYAVGIGGENGFARTKISQHLEKLGLTPLSILHESSYIDPTSFLDTGCVIMPTSVIHKFSLIGKYTIVNTNACIDHECHIGMGVHIMGSAAIAGRVKINDFATIGTNATILPDITIGEGAYVGAGAVVTHDVPPYSVTVGVPAKILRDNILKQPIGIDDLL